MSINNTLNEYEYKKIKFYIKCKRLKNKAYFDQFKLFTDFINSEFIFIGRKNKENYINGVYYIMENDILIEKKGKIILDIEEFIIIDTRLN